MSDAKQNWHIEGEYFESCNCKLLCPCLLSQAQAQPTEGHCDAVVAFQIKSGSFGKTDLSGLNAAVAIYTPGAMAQGNWTLAPYVDERGSQDQRVALEAIVTGSVGGPLGRLAPLVSKRMPAKAVPISFSAQGRTRKLSIPQIADVTVEGVVGAGGEVVWLDNVGHFASRRLAAATGPVSHFKDHGLSFDNSGRNGHYSAINWSSD